MGGAGRSPARPARPARRQQAVYCTLEDIKKQVSERALLACADDQGLGVPDQAVVDEAIRNAQAEIDAYAAARYPVPFSPVPQVIKKICVDIAIYHLFSRRGFDPEKAEDQVVVDRYRAAVKFLQDLARGLVQIGVAQPSQEGSAQFTSSPRVFTREALREL